MDILNEAEYGFTDTLSGSFYLHSSLLHTRNARSMYAKFGCARREDDRYLERAARLL